MGNIQLPRRPTAPLPLRAAVAIVSPKSLLPLQWLLMLSPRPRKSIPQKLPPLFISSMQQVIHINQIKFRIKPSCKTPSILWVCFVSEFLLGVPTDSDLVAIASIPPTQCLLTKAPSPRCV